MLVTHHEMGKHIERVFKKKSLKPDAASHNEASCYTDTDGLLEHLPSCGSLYYKGPTLQKIIQGVAPPYIFPVGKFTQLSLKLFTVVFLNQNSNKTHILQLVLLLLLSLQFIW